MSDLSVESSAARGGILRSLGSRSNFVAAIAFGIAAIFSFPLATILGLVGFAQARSSAETGLGALVFYALIALLIPLVAAFVAGATTKPTRTGPQVGGLLRNLIAWVLAVAAGPGMLVGWMLVGDARNARSFDARSGSQARPMVVTDPVGFCAPPVYGQEGGVPTVELTARVPHADNYGWTFEATDHAGNKLLAFVDTTLARGVWTVPLKVRFANDRPIVPADVEWPVVVTLLRVETRKPAGATATKWSDYRASDTLAVLPGPGQLE